PGTIYMYYARGGDSFNVSCAGEGNAVLIKAGVPFPYVLDAVLDPASESGAEPSGETAVIAEMRRRNPLPSGKRRPLERLCSGQTLLCRALGLRVPIWSGVAVDTPPLSLLEVGYRPGRVVRTTRLGIPKHRDGHLPYRFVDAEFARQATKNPFSPRSGRRGTARKALPGEVRELVVPSGGETVDWAKLLQR
ncbi:MAG: DNA-3-methyladenine glycosylase, partial [bacterium]